MRIHRQFRFQKMSLTYSKTRGACERNETQASSLETPTGPVAGTNFAGKLVREE